jgi:hypothetical protein
MRNRFLLPSLGCLLLIFSCKTMRMADSGPSFHTDPFLKSLLWAHADTAMRDILQHPDRYRLQIIYVQIDRDSAGRPSFRRYRYHENPAYYFYPASTVKLPIALAALEKVHRLQIPGLDKYTPMFTDSIMPGTPAVTQDTSAANGLPSIAQYIRKIFLVSDNDAANRLYEFVGQGALNRLLHQKGYVRTDILHRLNISLTEDQNRHSNPVEFRRDGRVLYSQPEMYNPDPYPQRHDEVGEGYISGAKRIDQPMDFSQKNRAPLAELLTMLQSVIFPASVPAENRFDLDESDYSFLYQAMSAFTNESRHPAYDMQVFPPASVKFLMYGAEDTAHILPDVRIYNKPGWAYGFMTDVAYVADFKHRVEFMLAATLYANRDEVLNDNHYEMDEVAKPFFRQLGQLIYHYELSRPRKYLPDLSRYSVSNKD